MSAPEQAHDFRKIFEEHGRYVWRALRNLGVADADVEDVCQEVFITVHRRLGDFEGRSTLRTWLYGICLRTASDYRRRARVRREQATSEPPLDAALDQATQGSAVAEARHAVKTLLDILDDEKREVVVLYEIEGFTMKEVAEIVGCPLQTAYSRLYSARELLKSHASTDAELVG